MKITNVEAYPVWGGHRNFLFVVVDTDEGIYGVGEAGITGRELAVMGAIEHFKPLLIGQNPANIEHIWQTLFRGGFFPAQRILSAAISAIDIALWDIKGKALGVPVYELLGGKVREKVVCYPHNRGHAMEIEPLVESCLETKEEGWKFVRWGLPQDGPILEPRQAVLTAIKQFHAVREAVGDEIEICFDVHTRLDLPDALWLCREVEDTRPYFIEDPLRSENPDSFKTLRPRTHVPLAAGEQFSSKWEFRQLIEEEWIDYARIDLCIVGGITEARKIAGWCETHYIKLAVHNPLGPVSSAACLQLNLATPNVGVQEQPRKPGTTLTDVVPVQPEWEDGYLLAPTRPGLGIEFDREAARRHPFQMTELPHLRRLDGSFTNW
ncbi:galactonate dehydratase [Litorilinea aerophila]|uniref:Galactonate dehydratase n=1 Tax=Litorilinea aerophila TaxID=1204385 RepID=A0A540VBV4_9CHLR|nr:galactonate dehydratase [Litorilinea aerophila]MCC9077991.1 galactonate dehydratase [Litorilinea aerophila]GIV76652.1 MAG: galactonate dehydratase [Litorilinea sp.]